MNDRHSHAVILAVCLAALVASEGPAFAQLDPLLFLKTTPKPNVVLVVDTANRMQADADNAYYDQAFYPRTGNAWEAPLGINAANTVAHYRRKYINLTHVDSSLFGDKFQATTIQGVGDLDPGYATFDAKTRLSVARLGLADALRDNQNLVRFALVRTRQSSPALGALGNEGPVAVTDPLQQSPTDLAWGKWKITRPTVATPNGFNNTVTPALVRADAAGANASILGILGKTPDQAGGLIPAGRDGLNILDAPVEYMLDDAKAEAVRLFAADGAGLGCRNTVVVLVVGGGEGNTAGSQNPAAKAATFLNVSGHRVPIYVIAIAPPAGSVAQLRSIATNSGGQYVEVTKAMIDAVAPGALVPEVTRAVNVAVQHAFASATDVNTAPTAELPYGPATEHQVTSPIIGTVNLDDLFPPIHHPTSGNVIPQRSNVMITAGFAIPGAVDTSGFPGRLRAFRVYRPVADSTKPSGYKFVGDGTPLWLARTPNPGEGDRKIYTVLPGETMMTPFLEDRAGVLRQYLNVSSVADAAALITYIRQQPLGAIVDSTPAILDPPSLDPPPDGDYPAFLAANTNRRTMVFVGANDGMLHAIDGRLGVEAWAFIPFNLLPKLRALREGQPVEKFEFFVDGSPKLADVKVGGEWRSFCIFGQGPGGTFYQALDVTMAGLSTASQQTPDAVLDYFDDPNHITFRWSYPRYEHFDCTLPPYGDLNNELLATELEKTVGETWSDPAVGQIQNASGPFVVLTGSGFLSYTKQTTASRGGAAAPVAGTTFYVFNVGTGEVLPGGSVNVNVDGDTVAYNVDNCSVVNDCTRIKNAVQADPVATGPPDSRFITKAYIGDLHGRLWRFDFSVNGPGITITGNRLFEGGTAHPMFSSMAVVNVGGANEYVFFGTGSDLLPSSGVSQSYKLFAVLDNGSDFPSSSSSSLDLERTDGASGDEKVSAFPAVAGDIVFFTTTTYKPTATCSLPDANIYALTFVFGAAYDSNGDDKVDHGDSPKVKTIAGGGRATAPFIVDQHLVVGIGGKVELFGDPEDFNNGVGQAGVRILSWREIR